MDEDLALERTAANRRRAADFFDGLDDGELSAPSLCHAWTVREVLGHLVMPMAGTLRGLLVGVIRERGSLDRASAAQARELARRPLPELTGLLREHADLAVRAPRVGLMGQLIDGCVHLRDCARPLGRPEDVSLDDWRLVLDVMVGGVPGLVPKRRVAGLALRAADQDWSVGDGEAVTGPSEALALALAGRAVAVADLAGPGLDGLRARLPSPPR